MSCTKDYLRGEGCSIEDCHIDGTLPFIGFELLWCWLGIYFQLKDRCWVWLRMNECHHPDKNQVHQTQTPFQI